jgi:tetratricopeptide (TPR) repeat protein
MKNNTSLSFVKRFLLQGASLLLLLGSMGVMAQEKDHYLSKANDQFADKQYADAEANYRISKSKANQKALASYNLGNAIYKQNQASEAKYAYIDAVEKSKLRSEKHNAFHNLGNVYMKEKKYTEAVAAFKDALRNDPTDEESRYNLALAKKLLKDNPPPKDDKKDDKKDKNKDKKDDKKDQKNQDKKDDKNKGDQDKKDDKKDQGKNPNNKDQNDPSQGQPKPKPGGISKERLQNLLDAVNNEEKKIQDKVNAKKIKGQPIQTEKDW